jgi:hypothetical protein
MSISHETSELTARRARARRTALFVALVPVGIYVLFWLGGVLRS